MGKEKQITATLLALVLENEVCIKQSLPVLLRNYIQLKEQKFEPEDQKIKGLKIRCLVFTGICTDSKVMSLNLTDANLCWVLLLLIQAYEITKMLQRSPRCLKEQINKKDGIIFAQFHY